MATSNYVKRLAGIAVAGLVAASVSAQACTNFLLKAADGTPVYARTLEYGTETAPAVVVVPRNYAYEGLRADNKPGPKWRSRYGFVGVMNLGEPYVSDGMNEKGLAGGSLYFPGFAGYVPLDKVDPHKAFAPWEFLTWLLSSFATVDEVKSVMNGVKIVALPVPKPGMDFVLPFHFAVHDASGASIVIEPVDGVLKVYDNPMGVLTNSPPFDWHVNNVRNYLKLSPLPAEPLQIAGQTFAPFGLGSGMQGLPGDSTPPSRFIRALAFVSTARQAPDGPQTVELAEHILNNFDLPSGFVLSAAKQGELETTQWSSIADLRARKYYIKSYHDQTLRGVDLNSVNLSGPSLLVSPLSDHRTIPALEFTKP